MTRKNTTSATVEKQAILLHTLSLLLAEAGYIRGLSDCCSGIYVQGSRTTLRGLGESLLRHRTLSDCRNGADPWEEVALQRQGSTSSGRSLTARSFRHSDTYKVFLYMTRCPCGRLLQTCSC